MLAFAFDSIYIFNFSREITTIPTRPGFCPFLEFLSFPPLFFSLLSLQALLSHSILSFLNYSFFTSKLLTHTISLFSASLHFLLFSLPSSSFNIFFHFFSLAPFVLFSQTLAPLRVCSSWDQTLFFLILPLELLGSFGYCSFD